MFRKTNFDFVLINSNEFLVLVTNDWVYKNTSGHSCSFSSGYDYVETPYVLNDEVYFLGIPSFNKQAFEKKYKYFHIPKSDILSNDSLNILDYTPIEIDWDFELYSNLSSWLLNSESYNISDWDYMFYNKPIYDVTANQAIIKDNYLVIPITISLSEGEFLGNTKRRCYESTEDSELSFLSEILVFKENDFIGKIQLDNKIAEELFFGKMSVTIENGVFCFNDLPPLKQNKVDLYMGNYGYNGYFRPEINVKNNIIQTIKKEMITVQKSITQLGNPNDNDSAEKLKTVEFDTDFEISKYTLSFGLARDLYNIPGYEDNNVYYENWFDDMPNNPYHIPFYNKIETNGGYIDLFRILCNRLSELEGLQPAYPYSQIKNYHYFLDLDGYPTIDPSKVEGYRLPTLFEWEYAANGGHLNTENYLYSGSNNPEDVGWFSSNSSDIQPSGLKQPNQLGIYDMSGNLTEITADTIDWNKFVYPEQDKTLKNRAEIQISSGYRRILKGGNAIDFSPQPNYSLSIDCKEDYNFRGLRIVRTLNPKKERFEKEFNNNRIKWLFKHNAYGFEYHSLHSLIYPLENGRVFHRFQDNFYIFSSDGKLTEESYNVYKTSYEKGTVVEFAEIENFYKKSDYFVIAREFNGFPSDFATFDFNLELKKTFKKEISYNGFFNYKNNQIIAYTDDTSYILNENFDVLMELNSALSNLKQKPKYLGIDLSDNLFIKNGGLLCVLNLNTNYYSENISLIFDTSYNYEENYKDLFAIDLDNSVYFFDQNQNLVKYISNHPDLLLKYIFSGYSSACAIDENDNLYVWGYDYYGQISGMPTGLKWKQVACGPYHTAAIDIDDNLHIWGSDNCGQVSYMPTGLKWKQVACGSYHTAAIDIDDNLHCWGYDNYGQVSGMPTGLKWKFVSSGSYFTAAIDIDDNLHICGKDNYGQVSDMPTGKKWKYVSCSYGYNGNIAAIDENNDLYMWGNDSYSQCSNMPQGLKWKRVACGIYSTVGIDENDDFYGWGNDGYGHFSNVPLNKKWKQIACGNDYVLGIDSDDILHIWGDDDTIYNSKPTKPLPSIINFSDEYLYPYSNLVIDVYGNLYFAYQDINLDNILVSYTNTGEKRWETILHPNNEAIEIHDILIAENETLFVLTNHGTIFNLDLNGNIVDRIEFTNPHKYEEGWSFNMKLADDGMLYVIRPYEGLYAIQTDTKGLMKDCWACRKQNNDETGYYR